MSVVSFLLLSLVTEYADNGDLDQLIRSKK